MSRIFEMLTHSDYCYGNIKSCVELTHENFREYSIWDRCGYGDDPYNIFSLDKTRVFSAKVAPYSFTIKLKHKPVNPFAYRIEMRENNEECYWSYPTNFTFFGSVNGNTWYELDHKEDNQQLSQRGTLISFPVRKTRFLFQYFKFAVYNIDRPEVDIWSSIGQFEINGTFSVPRTCENQHRSFIERYFFIINICLI